MEEITETLEIVEDEEALKSISEAEEDVKAGRIRTYSDLKGELKLLVGKSARSRI